MADSTTNPTIQADVAGRSGASEVVPSSTGGELHHVPGFEQFLDDEYGPLLGFLRRRTASEGDAQDAVQESMARLVRYRDREPAASWKPLLYRIAINVAHDQRRRRSHRKTGQHVPIDSPGVALASAQPSHEQRLDTERELAIIRELILQLPERCRQVYLLNRIEGMTYREVAAQCAISVKTVEKHIAKALKMLRKGMAKYETGQPGGGS